MSFRSALLHFPLILGAFGTEWSVKYNQQEICALEGSTVFMNGTYTHPEGLTVTEIFWGINPVRGVEPTNLNKDPDYSGRVEYLRTEPKHFSLRLSEVKKTDEHQYACRITTNNETQKWVGTPGLQLTVTDLHVEAPGEVTEGGTAVLTCRTTCSLTDPTFIWYKNGRPLTTKTIKNNQLHLQNVSSENAGSYSCAAGGYQHLPSTNQTLRVRYAPKKVTVSISPPGKIMEGRSVNLTCSSDANPPVKNYTWFKEGESSPVGFGHSYSTLQRGAYYCKAQNEHGDRKSTVVSVVVKGSPNAVIYAVAGGGCGVIVLIIICIFFIWNKRRVKKKEEIMVNTVYAEIWGVPANDDAAPNSSDSSDAVYADVVQPNLYETIQAESSSVKTSVCMTAVEEDVKEKSLEADVLYSTIRFPHVSMANRSNDETEDSSSGIYICLK